jgi:hypothetical protein
MRTEYEVAEVIARNWEEIVEKGKYNRWQVRTLSAIRICRTPAIGGHIDACDACGNIRISYNSCRNRHCPKCQGEKRNQWIHARETELLPVPYFHVVFTLPQELNEMVLYKPREVYNALFEAAWGTLTAFNGSNKGGMIAVLHTWGQNLSLHPHLHCIVPGCTINPNGGIQQSKNKGKFLYPVKALSKVFRAKYMASLRKKTPIPIHISKAIYQKEWVVYAKQPFGNVKSVVEYLGRYTHKIAISNHRIKEIGTQSITFSYKDYKSDGRAKLMTLSQSEFLRRFAQHILPKRFVRIRHYGFLSSTWKRQKLQALQEQMCVKPKVILQAKTYKCPCCKIGNMIMIERFDARGPPKYYVVSEIVIPQAVS